MKFEAFVCTLVGIAATSKKDTFYQYENVTIQYTERLRDDWRILEARLDPQLKYRMNNEMPWRNFSRAQDQEDIWLYENWFYGHSNGLILESGALDGFVFSTSFMFERYLKWTAIHVGKN